MHSKRIPGIIIAANIYMPDIMLFYHCYSIIIHTTVFIFHAHTYKHTSSSNALYSCLLLFFFLLCPPPPPLSLSISHNKGEKHNNKHLILQLHTFSLWSILEIRERNMGNASVKGGHNSKYFIQNNSGANRRIRNMTNYTWASKCLFSAFMSKTSFLASILF